MSIFRSIGKGLSSFWGAGKSVANTMIPIMGSGVQGYAQSGGSYWGAAGGMLSALGASQQNDANSAQVERQMHFQQMMSNSAYQRAMRDMRLAGLNPILAGQVGGASTPSGASANMVNVADSASQNAARTANTSMALKQQKKTFEETDARISNIQNDTNLKAENMSLMTAQKNLLNWQRERAKWDANSAKQLSLTNDVLGRLERRNAQWLIDHPEIFKTGETAGVLGRLLGAGNSARTLIAPAK